jgi:hypothetical protein
VYVANLRARIRCPVCLLVIAADEAVARWAGKAVELGGGNRFVPWVLGLSGVQAMDASKYQYQSEFARRYFGQGKAAGVVEGRVEIILKLLATRYGAVPAAIEAHVRAAGSTELDRFAERVLTARTVEEALGIPCT